MGETIYTSAQWVTDHFHRLESETWQFRFMTPKQSHIPLLRGALKPPGLIPLEGLRNILSLLVPMLVKGVCCMLWSIELEEETI